KPSFTYPRISSGPPLLVGWAPPTEPEAVVGGADPTRSGQHLRACVSVRGHETCCAIGRARTLPYGPWPESHKDSLEPALGSGITPVAALAGRGAGSRGVGVAGRVGR